MSGKPFHPDEIDIRAGQLIATFRQQQGLSQKDLANQLGITSQQIQKYETAGNRISISRFYKILQVLQVSFSGFFTELGNSALYDEPMRRAIDRLWRLPANDQKLIYAMIDRLWSDVNKAVVPQKKKFTGLPRKFLQNG